MKRTQRVRNVKEEDAEQITKIFNSYIGTGFAAFSEQSIPTEIFFFQMTVSTGFPCVVVVCDSSEGGKEEIVGFGISRQHHSGSSAFKRVAEVSYFVKETETHKGIGTMILKELERRLHEEHEIIQLLAEVASVNTQSIGFHENRGFKRVGQFFDVGFKDGISFDLLWFQKTISSVSMFPVEKII